MIQVNNLDKSFNKKNVLHNINFSCKQGEVTNIIGASGSGKTTLLKIMVGLIKPDSGNIIYDGADFTELNFNHKKLIRQCIGMLFQSSALLDSLTVQQNLLLPLNMLSNLNKKEKLYRIRFCLDRVNLKDVSKKYPSELSGGMQKRVGLARAIVMQPKYLFCDEPNSGLDPLTASIINNLIKEITKDFNTTTLVITHDMNSVLEIGDKIIFLHKGQKWWEVNKNNILDSNNLELSEFVLKGCLVNKIKNN
ncbi:MAG: ABC transporter ATP-binding protein [Solitalea-like symbiont of Acarus siro]